jgi:hypothetical protein
MSTDDCRPLTRGNRDETADRDPLHHIHRNQEVTLDDVYRDAGLDKAPRRPRRAPRRERSRRSTEPPKIEPSSIPDLRMTRKTSRLGLPGTRPGRN